MTVGWILEGDRDRFLAARDPTPPPAPVSISFRCPFCKSSFPDRKQLDSHVQLLHVLKRPFILIGGTEPGAEDVIRPSLTAPSIEAFNCTGMTAGFDGEPVRPTRPTILAKRLGRTSRAILRLRLINTGDGLTQPVVQEYHLRVLAPDEAALAKIDELFLQELGADSVNLERVGLFYDATRDGAAAEYAEAVGDYVRAVLLKDDDPRTGVSTRLHHYHEVQNKALNVLRSYDRPLAKLLCALLRFNLNDFSRWDEVTGFAQLDHAYALLGPLAHQIEAEGGVSDSKVRRRNHRVFVCPVDLGTDMVTELARQAAELPRWGSAAEEQFSVLAERANIDSFDRAKIRALWAMAALRLGATMSAQRALRLLDDDPTFGAWANCNLTEVES